MYSARGDRAWEWLKRRGRGLEPPRPVAIASAVVFAAATVARSAKLPDDAFWQPGKAPIWILLVSGAVTGVSATINAIRLSRRTRKSTLFEACLQLAAYIDDACPGLSLREVGVHVWRVGGPFWARRLRRTQRFLLRHRQESHVGFTAGKGVIGRVWVGRADEIRNLEEIHARVAGKDDFDALSDDDRLGLEWDEYQRTKRYTAVWAAPLFRGSSMNEPVVGVISVDVQTPGVFEELRKATTTDQGPELAAILAACETALGE